MTQPSATSRRSTALKLAVLAAVVGGVVVLIASGALDTLRDREQVEDWLNDAGVWGPVLFILAFVVAQPISLPGAALIIPATFVWPWYEVFAYSLAGGMVASTMGFVTARFIAKDWVQQRLPARLEPWDERLERNGFPAVVGLRLVTGYAPAADWVLGVSQVRWAPFVAGTFFGLMPTTAVLAVWGDDAARFIGGSPLMALGIVAVLGAVGFVVHRRRRRLAD